MPYTYASVCSANGNMLIIKRTKVSRRQVYRALQFLKSVNLADDIHGYWYEKIAH